MNSIGQKVKCVRKDKNMTQLEFSQKLCVSRPFISRIEHGKDKPSGTLIRLISYMFDVDEDWLKGFSE